VAALLPDADALVRSSADPLLYAEFHRHFTHSLAFIPVGGAIAALPWLLQGKRRTQWKAYLAAATFGVPAAWRVGARRVGGPLGQRRVDPASLWRELAGRDPRHRPVP
jgi:hypothetical protein